MPHETYRTLKYRSLLASWKPSKSNRLRMQIYNLSMLSIHSFAVIPLRWWRQVVSAFGVLEDGLDKRE